MWLSEAWLVSTSNNQRPAMQWLMNYVSNNEDGDNNGDTSGVNSIVVRARGTSGSEHIILLVNDETIASWTLGTSYQDYSTSTDYTGEILVQFDNDGNGLDVQIDYITVNSATRQAEEQSYNTGVWQDGSCGVSYSEWLHCNGSIGFGNVLDDDSGNDGTNITLNGTYSIIASHSGKALDTYNWGTSDGTNIVQWTYWGGETQQFDITPVDGEWHRITPVISTGQALDVENISTADGANVFTWSWWGGEGQQSRFQSAGSEVWKIIAKHSEKCIDVEGVSTADGVNVFQWTCISDAANQMFELINLKNTEEAINLIEPISEIIIYPNPVKNGILNIQLIGLKGQTNINIFDINGKLLKKLTAIDEEFKQIQLNLNPGFYFVNIINGSKNVVKKLTVD